MSVSARELQTASVRVWLKARRRWERARVKRKGHSPLARPMENARLALWKETSMWEYVMASAKASAKELGWLELPMARAREHQKAGALWAPQKATTSAAWARACRTESSGTSTRRWRTRGDTRRGRIA